MIDTGLQGKTAIITGGASGIGRATAQAFAAEGCRIAVWDVKEIEADELGVEEDRFCSMRVDVTDSEQVDAAVADVVSRWGAIDVLVNNAGIVRDGLLVKWKNGELAKRMSDEAFSSVIDVNLKGVFNGTRAVVPHMIEGGGGVILSASSVVGLYGNFGQTNYVATKAGVIGMTKVWARELGRHGIRANVVAPGFVKTEILAAMPDKVLDGMVAHTPAGRIGEPGDIANAYVWLASDAASFVTGAVLSVDGGLVVGT